MFAAVMFGWFSVVSKRNLDCAGYVPFGDIPQRRLQLLDAVGGFVGYLFTDAEYLWIFLFALSAA